MSYPIAFEIRADLVEMSRSLCASGSAGSPILGEPALLEEEGLRSSEPFYGGAAQCVLNVSHHWKSFDSMSRKEIAESMPRFLGKGVKIHFHLAVDREQTGVGISQGNILDTLQNRKIFLLEAPTLC